MAWVVNTLVMESCGRRRWWVALLVQSLRYTQAVWMVVCVLRWGRSDWRLGDSSLEVSSC